MYDSSVVLPQCCYGAAAPWPGAVTLSANQYGSVLRLLHNADHILVTKTHQGAVSPVSCVVCIANGP